jgi:hypothetical protein
VGGGGVGTAVEAETIKGEEPTDKRLLDRSSNLPKGITQNERGTITASSEAAGPDMPDIISPQDAEAQRQMSMDRLRRNFQDLFR